jgi:hypothetical protein
MQGERTGLTPQFSGPEPTGNAINGAASPFSQMFGAGSGFTSMDGLGADIDWVSLLLDLAKLVGDNFLTLFCRVLGTPTSKAQVVTTSTRQSGQ